MNHIDPDCEVSRGVGWMCTCSTPQEKAERAEFESERDTIAPVFDLRTHLQRQREFSERTFGPGPRTAGVVDHIRKELSEIESKPADLSEWIDVVILGFDGAWRAGYSPDDIIAELIRKQTKNETRTWPDWRTAETGKAIEHDRTVD